VSRSRSLLACLSAAAALAAGAEAQQAEQPVFRSGTAVVEVTVIVRDRSGAFVPDLTIDDFEVVEGDAPQRVEMLYLVESPVARDAGRRGEAKDARTDERTARRTFVFLFDVEHLSPGGLTRARAAVVRFAGDRLAPADLAGVVGVGTGGRGEVSTDREALFAALKALKVRGDSLSRAAYLKQWPRLANEAEAIQVGRGDEGALARAVERACTEQPAACSGPSADPLPAAIGAEIQQKALTFTREARAAAQRSIATLDRIARGLRDLPGRKTIVWLTEGTFSDEITEQAREASYRAAQSGTAIYALDPRGLGRRAAGSPDAIAPGEVGMDVLLASAEDAADLLAFGSGGLSIRDENNLDRALRRIEDDTSTFYVLGYAAPPDRAQPGFRRLTVRVRRPGVAVRARHGYIAPARVTTLRAAASPGSLELPGAPISPAEAHVPAAPDPLPAATVTPGTLVAGPAAPAADAIRLRPGAVARAESLSAQETAAPGTPAQEGWAAYQRGDVEAALPLLSRAAAEPQARPWILYTLGLSQAALGRGEDAIASWERVRRDAPEFVEVYIDLADAYAQQLQLTNALDVLRDAERRWPSNPEIHNAIGVIYVRRGALDDAVEAFMKAAAAAPGDPLAYFNLGRAYEMRYVRSRRYVSSQRRWTASDDDRRRATENYERCVKLGGPYAGQAAEAISRLAWTAR